MIRVGFSTTGAAVSRAIREATHASVSHAFLTFDDPTLGGDLVIEAGWSGLEIHTFAHVQKSTEIIALVEPGDDLSAGLQRLAREYLGCPYDYLGIAGFPWVLLCRATGRHPRNPFERAGALFCSEAVTLVLQWSGYPGSNKLDPACVSPQDLYVFLRGQGALQTLHFPKG